MNQLVATHSHLKSVRLFEGTFYTSGWDVVFIPLNTHETEKYFSLVNRAEIARGRSLRVYELLQLAQEV